MHPAIIVQFTSKSIGLMQMTLMFHFEISNLIPSQSPTRNISPRSQRKQKKDNPNCCRILQIENQIAKWKLKQSYYRVDQLSNDLHCHIRLNVRDPPKLLTTLETRKNPEISQNRTRCSIDCTYCFFDTVKRLRNQKEIYKYTNSIHFVIEHNRLLYRQSKSK